MLEAAEMDGAGAVRRFFQITYPTIKPVFSVVVILSTIWDFKVFAQIYLMPGGSGSNREVLNLGVWSYVESFGQNRYGFGAAIAVLLTVLLLIITAIYVRTLFKEEKV
jgi:N,N'-diacetylchitobiose transport system permease protein